ncbi:molecular chaperone TorD family protein [Vibrio makurazakiensis]|uniref:TorD/DmsD family molecular chaperone n=1 Tax=Vibrio makurazakiensis TaxID=2910250 RepID=UPI003D0D426F
MEIEQEQSLRTDIYLLIASLVRQEPSEELLTWLSELETSSSQDLMSIAWVDLKQAARTHAVEQVTEEYQNLFIGIGRGEVVPFASWHLTGSLMEKPLALIRQDLSTLGFERSETTKEPEDHIAALCEVMAMLHDQPQTVQRDFFNAHVATWYAKLIEQIESAKSAQFYLAVARLMKAFFDYEQVSFVQAPVSTKPVNKIEVKNIVDSEVNPSH